MYLKQGKRIKRRRKWRRKKLDRACRLDEDDLEQMLFGPHQFLPPDSEFNQEEEEGGTYRRK